MKNYLKRIISMVMVLSITLSILGFGLVAQATATKSVKKTFLIGMSQCNLGEPWRVAMNAQLKEAAKKYPEFKVVYADAAQDNAKQVADIENFIQQKVDLLIASPNEAKPLTSVIKKAFEAGIPVILLDRGIEGNTFTQFIGADNVLIGRECGKYVATKLLPKGGNILEIKGLEGTTGGVDRNNGFREGIKANPKCKIIAAQNADWIREKAITVAEAMLQANKKVNLIFALNDPMAEGAYIAAKNAGREKEMKFVGVDGLPTPDGGIKSVIDKRLSLTMIYPTGGKEAILSAYKLLVKGQKLVKKVVLGTEVVTPVNAQAIYKRYGGK